MTAPNNEFAIQTWESTPSVVSSTGPLLGIIKQFYIGQLGTSAATLYTAPAAHSVANPLGINPKAVVEEVWICNTDTSTRTATLYLVESGGTTADNRAILKDFTLLPKESRQIKGRFVLEAAGMVRGLADSANLVTVAISGTEYA